MSDVLTAETIREALDRLWDTPYRPTPVIVSRPQFRAIQRMIVSFAIEGIVGGRQRFAPYRTERGVGPGKRIRSRVPFRRRRELALEEVARLWAAEAADG